MKKSLLSISIALLSINASATDVNEVCRNLEKLAGVVQTANQTSVPMSDVLDKVKTVTDDRKIRRFLENMIIRAYEMPLQYSERYKELVVKEFMKASYLQCYKELRDYE
jgi:hypothetical protein